MIESKDYFIDLINSSKANQFTSRYHYSGVGFRKALINQGIFRKSDNLLVGVLQWGVSCQENIRLDRYVKEPLTKESYLELNRFCMADSEGKNSESQAISIGMKWIKQNRPDIQLLVSYAGRKEGNYGYIYQATNWEYLGYFLSTGFWILDGEERHQITLWNRYKLHLDNGLPFTEALCKEYHDVRQTTSKQFIYVQRLNKRLHLASPILPYPKPSNEFPIQTKVVVLKENEEFKNAYQLKPKELIEYYYEPEKYLFSRAALIRKGELKVIKKKIACYNNAGELNEIFESIEEITEYFNFTNRQGISNALKTGNAYKNYFFKYFNEDELPEDFIDVKYICEIDDLRFLTQSEVSRYLNVSRQAVSVARQKNNPYINGIKVYWKHYSNSDIQEYDLFSSDD